MAVSHKFIEIQGDYRFQMGTQNKRRNMQKNKGCHCVLKTPGKHKEVGGEKIILWARVSPSLSSCPSAKPNYSTTTGILYLWLSGLNQKAVASAGTLKTTWFNTFYRKENGGPARTRSYSLMVIGLPTPRTDSFQGPHCHLQPWQSLKWKAELKKWLKGERGGVRQWNGVLKLPNSEQEWAITACQTQASCHQPGPCSSLAGPVSARREHRGKTRRWQPITVLEGKKGSQCGWLSSPESPGSCKVLSPLWHLTSRNALGAERGK